MTKETRPHPDHEWLLLYSDGELPQEARVAMQKHLEACWECRHELQEVEGTIGDAIRYRKEVMAKHMPPPPEPWRDLRAGFARIDRELAPPSLLDRIGAALRMPRLAIPLAAAVAFGAVMIVRQVNTSAPEQPVLFPAEPRTFDAPSTSGSASNEILGETRKSGEPAATADVPVSAPVAGSVAEVLNSEVQVFSVLHQQKADLGEPIEVSRENGRVIVRGLGLDPARVQELTPLLARIPFVDTRWNEGGATGAATTVTRFVGGSGPSPFQRELEMTLGGTAMVDAWASECLDRTDAILDRAHALRRLNDAFTKDGANDELTAMDRQMLGALREDHLKAMTAELKQLQRQLAPVLHALGADGVIGTPPGSLIEAARRLESSVAELTGAKTLEGSAMQLPPRVAGDLAQALIASGAARP